VLGEKSVDLLFMLMATKIHNTMLRQEMKNTEKVTCGIEIHALKIIIQFKERTILRITARIFQDLKS